VVAKLFCIELNELLENWCAAPFFAPEIKSIGWDAAIYRKGVLIIAR